jgi:hypothetical protein
MDEIKKEEPEILDKDHARENIMFIRQNIYMLGANDREFSEIDIILKDLEDGAIEPEEAVRRAFVIENSKQDYH